MRTYPFEHMYSMSLVFCLNLLKRFYDKFYLRSSSMTNSSDALIGRGKKRISQSKNKKNISAQQGKFCLHFKDKKKKGLKIIPTKTEVDTSKF